MYLNKQASHQRSLKGCQDEDLHDRIHNLKAGKVSNTLQPVKSQKESHKVPHKKVIYYQNNLEWSIQCIALESKRYLN